MNLQPDEINFAYKFLSDRESYHHHKEQMAYVGFLVQTAFFTAIMTFNWGNSLAHPQLMLLLVVPFWVLVHRFIRWQLRLRRFAALQVATLLNVILKNLSRDHEADMKSTNPAGEIKDDNITKQRRQQRPAEIDYWIPCRSARIFSDVEIQAFPKWYQEEFKAVSGRRTGALMGEHLVTWGSWLILASMIVRLTLLL